MANEAELEQRYKAEAGVKALYSLDAILDIHRTLFARLPSADLAAVEGQPITPGEVRQREVSVGRHVAPAASRIQPFLQRWAEAYGGVRKGEANISLLDSLKAFVSEQVNDRGFGTSSE